ncbi:hypothetical protein SDJN03_20966, partial [Cucurbita argyrosperma subsp. sororia]
MCHETVQIEAMETRKHMSDNTRLFPTFFFLPPILFIPTENEATNSAPRFPFSAFPVSSISSFFSFNLQWRWLSSPLSCSWLSLRFPCFKPLSWLAMDVVVEAGTHTDQGASRSSNAQIGAPLGAGGHNTTNHACSSAKSAAGSACVCPLATTETKPCALATTTGRPRKEDPNALKKTNSLISISISI